MKKFENWESYVAGKIGLAMAVNYSLQAGEENIWQRIEHLSGFFGDQLTNLPGVIVQDLGKTKFGIVTLSKDNESATELQQRLKTHNIETSVSKVGSVRLDYEERGLDET